jgi:Tol biopolymer transport system component
MRRVLFFFALFLLLVCAACAPAVPARIFYACPTVEGVTEGGLCVVNTDGSNPTLWLSAGVINKSPAFFFDIAPDRTRVVYNPVKDVDRALYFGEALYITSLMEGKASTRITSQPGYYGIPAFAPDGQRVAFFYSRSLAPSFEPNLYMINVDGSGLQQLTHYTSQQDWGMGSLMLPGAWSPDGNKIVFLTENGNSQALENTVLTIYSFQDGTTRTLGQLPGKGFSYAPRISWSPDSRQLAISVYDESYNGLLYIINIDGSGYKQLSGAAENCIGPDWSPMVNRIVCANPQAGEILIYSLDGSVQRLTGTFGHSTFSAFWSPDGSQIAYYAFTESSLYINMVDVRNSSTTRLVDIAFDPSGGSFLPYIFWQGTTRPGGLAITDILFALGILALLVLVIFILSKTLVPRLRIQRSIHQPAPAHPYSAQQMNYPAQPQYPAPMANYPPPQEPIYQPPQYPAPQVSPPPPYDVPIQPYIPPAPPTPSPDEIADWYRQGAALVQEKKFAEARPLLKRVVDARPDHANAWLWLGWVHASLGDLPTAEACFRRSRTLGDPNAAAALDWLEKKRSKGFTTS